MAGMPSVTTIELPWDILALEQILPWDNPRTESGTRKLVDTMKSKKGRSDYAMPDLACARCRERKIRCGRERPECRNCEREPGVVCIYRVPAKRVNHLKLLCDSVERLQDRLTNIESHLHRLQGSGFRAPNFNEGRTAPCIYLLGGRQSATSSNYSSYTDEDESRREDATQDVTDPKIEGSSAGLTSISGLCDQLWRRVQAANTADPSWRPLCDTLQHLCEITGTVEPFPPYSDRIAAPLLPKEQAITAVDSFLQSQDCQTDVFVPGSLRANLERVYSQHPQQPDDDTWAICFQAITILGLRLETSTQAGFGESARSFLPSRAALVNSRLLTTPRLINVQTLILLSVAAQHFDPPGWAELIFAHACMLARTMHMHASPLLLNNGSDVQVERAKVLRALYVRDRMLCLTRGSVSWLPSEDSNITAQLRLTVDHDELYTDRLRLALIQEDVYHLSHGGSARLTVRSAPGLLQTIEQQLEDYACAFDLLQGQYHDASEYNGTRALAAMEFLNTRIIAFQHGREERHARQVRQDARTSCLLLLMAYGDPDPTILNTFNILTRGTASRNNTQQSTTPPGAAPFGTVLDVFPVPAFFVLLQDIILPPSSGINNIATDLDLLRRVSACYTDHASRSRTNNHHQKVAWVFAQLLALLELVPRDGPALPSTSPPQSNDPPSPSYWAPPPPAGVSLAWDSWLSGTSSLGLTPLEPGTSMGAWNLVNIQGHSGGEPIMPWPAMGEDGPAPTGLRGSPESAANTMMSPM
ncbi:hypothetical protein BO70DRAFT_429989 [Aspergillus heteromorphus CBS 117.55]|uniref:Zn(2)-C6 fungal-type domain-containing protein n=1 Tax=Aspergillus heteromorphus CBS 117.55 TaxID=1448321 RepID=A0A317W1Y0_9EURO|nr:uncharacterized protein BO70DRAFT_429989 [Aspergillus heteromorphus CBS 117.55]PWY79188.1 hypothetical protein BO70DRAFT_429989 [Aspergillus heteromorphus CBS 117.55]